MNVVTQRINRLETPLMSPLLADAARKYTNESLAASARDVALANLSDMSAKSVLGNDALSQVENSMKNISRPPNIEA
jgi:hypothetical protein